MGDTLGITSFTGKSVQVPTGELPDYMESLDHLEKLARDPEKMAQLEDVERKTRTAYNRDQVPVPVMEGEQLFYDMKNINDRGQLKIIRLSNKLDSKNAQILDVLDAAGAHDAETLAQFTKRDADKNYITNKKISLAKDVYDMALAPYIEEYKASMSGVDPAMAKMASQSEDPQIVEMFGAGAGSAIEMAINDYQKWQTTKPKTAAEANKKTQSELAYRSLKDLQEQLGVYLGVDTSGKSQPGQGQGQPRQGQGQPGQAKGLDLPVDGNTVMIDPNNIAPQEDKNTYYDYSSGKREQVNPF